MPSKWIEALIVVGAVGLGCGGRSSPEARRALPYAPAEYRVGVEDVLHVQVWKEPDLSTTTPVRPDGKITVPVAGELVAAGRSARELEAEITKRLAARVTAPVVTVVVKELNSSRVFVLGEVARPGAYPLRGALTIVQALALAGGLTEFADQDELTILRRTAGGDQRTLRLSFEDAADGPIELQPGDTVLVP